MAKYLKQYEILYKKARVDLQVSKILLENFDNGNDELDLESIMFHLQQCAEKLIKVILDKNIIKFPHSHDIEELINLAKNKNIKLPENIEKLIPLSEYAVEGRYAIIHDDLEDAQSYIDVLEILIIEVKNLIDFKLEDNNE